MRSPIELEFWQEIFRAALGNPAVTNRLFSISVDTDTLFADNLAKFADQAVKALRERTSEKDTEIHFLGAPK